MGKQKKTESPPARKKKKTADEHRNVPASPPNGADSDYHLAYLEAELQRIDLRVRQQARLWQIAGQDCGDAFRGIRITDDDAARLTQVPVGGHWGQIARMDDAEVAQWEDALVEANTTVQQVAKQAADSSIQPRLLHLAHTFRLNQFEFDVLLIALAPALDLRYQKLYGYLQDDLRLKQPTVNLALDLLCPFGLSRLSNLKTFSPDGPLFKYELLQPVAIAANGDPAILNQPLVIDPTLVAWLFEEYRPHCELDGCMRLLLPGDQNADIVVAAEAWPRLVEAIHDQPVLSFYGPDLETQDTVSHLIGQSLERSLLRVDLRAAAAKGISPLRALRLALRDARLTHAVVQLFAWEACLEDDEAPLELLSEIVSHPDLVILSSQKRWYARKVARDIPILWLEFPHPSYAHRQTLWSHYLDHTSQDESSDSPIDVALLAGQFVLSSGQIRDAIAAASDGAIQRGDKLPSSDDLFAAARAQSSSRLTELARKIEPRYEWEDLVLPADQLDILKEIVDMVRSRPTVLESWGLGKKLASSAAVTVLFAGPPGTGKTMAAEVIAGELGLDLYKIDLSSMVSKYIGETEKNLDKIFSEAQSSNAILFFDEADAIFGKRSQVKDARDRYANIEVSYLLQRMETYDGVTILATNLRANLDEAFLRRLQFAIDVPFPDEHDRLRIWQTLMPADLPQEPDLNLEEMAKRFKLAGGNIRNIIVTAAYQAASNGGYVTMDHLMHGTRRELQKMGRLVSESHMQIK